MGVIDDKPSIIFISSAIQQPRHQKRIASLAKHFSVYVIFNTRPLYKDNIKSFDHPQELCLNLGEVENNAYHKRLSLFWRLVSALRSRPEQLVYSTSMEGTLAALLAGKQLAHELGDLHQFGSLAIVYKMLDRVILARAKALLLTSPWFINEYYLKLFPQYADKYHLIENKMPLQQAAAVQEYRQQQGQFKLDNARVKLGLIGMIRFPDQLRAIASLVDSNPNLELHIYGEGETAIFEGLPRCTIHGSFRSPDDLQQIYDSIDVTLILYDNNDINVQWALPNKLYESIAYLKPILCSDNCCLGSVVEEKSFGVACATDKLDEGLGRLLKDYDSIRETMQKVAPTEYIDDPNAVTHILTAIQ